MGTKFQLKNGLDVVFIPSQKSPVVSVQAWVHTGSADEPKGLEGISHFIEHLVFKGTDKYKVGELAQKVESSGGQFNAYTSFDQTVFYVTISTHFKEVPFDVLSQMMGYPIFDADEIDNEREVVIEEIKRTLDNPSRAGSRLLFESSYLKHNYRKPVIGKESVIKSINPAAIKKYFKEKYSPKNMTLIICGDLTLNEAKSLSKKYFENIDSSAYKKTKREKELLPKSSKVKVEKSEFKENLLYLSWPIPAAKHKDVIALEVLALILGQGDSSRLSRRLRLERALCNYAGSSMFTPKDPGIFVISASMNFATLSDFFSELLLVVEQFLKEGPTVDEVTKAFINFESDLYYGMETVDGLASTAGLHEHIYSDYKMLNENLKAMKSLTPKELLRIARKYLDPNKLRASLLVEDKEEVYKKELSSFVKAYKKSFDAIKGFKSVEEMGRSKQTKWISKSPKSKGFQEYSLQSGSKIVFYPSYDTPLVNVRVGFLGGLRDEIKPDSGSVEFLSRIWCAGSKKYSEEIIDKIMDQSASRISAFSGRNTSGVSLTTFAPFLSQTFDVFEECLLSPLLSNEVVEREKPLVIERIRKNADNGAQLCVSDFLKSMFVAHAYSGDMMGSLEEVSALTSQDLSAQWKKTIANKGATYVVTGSISDEDYLLTQIKRLDQSLKFNDTNLLKEVPIQAIEKNQFSFKELKKEQSHLILGYRGLKINSLDKPTLDVLQSILAGQGGRLFFELRDKQSLAYSVSPVRMDGVDGGYFGAYIACSPDKINSAYEGLVKELELIAEKGVTEKELSGAKRNIIGRHDISLQKVSSIGSSLLFDVIYGQAKEDTFNYPRVIEKVTAESIKQLARKLFSQPKIVAAVGQQDINASYK